jgi:hypothetical protein
MNARNTNTLRLLIASILTFFSLNTVAAPKAAEHEDAPVTVGADIAKPKPAAKPAKQQATGKAKPAPKGKPVNTNKPPKKAKTASAK